MRKRQLIPSDDEHSSELRSSKKTMSSTFPPEGEVDEPAGKMPREYSSSLSRDDEPTSSLHEINPSPVNNNNGDMPVSRNDDATQQQQQPGLLQGGPAEPQAPQIPNATDASSSSSPPPKAPNERKMFFAFVKVLLKYLEKAEANTLRNRAKAIIAECTVRNRNGDADYLCLQGAIERRLQQSLGPYHWDRAQLCYHKFLERCRMPSAIEVTSSACV